ncbi:MAG: class I SAM-dependent methyltransferase [Chloroflexota bacterium]|nr:MAG: class I SAM-dependent methyltransferase [Chloroflexota bacterium]
MPEKKSESEYWDKAVEEVAGRPDFDPLLAEQHRRIYSGLIAKWTDVTGSERILKTDLFAEAVHPSRSFLWDLLQANLRVVGIDISTEVTGRARANTLHYVSRSSAQYVSCDVRKLPFANNTFDLIVSDSTLDHFHYTHEIDTSLSELSRVLRPGGTLIITMDNKSNFTEPLFRIWLFLRLYPVFVGRTYSIEELKKALASTGFVVADTTAIIHNPRFIVRRIIPLVRKAAPVRFDGFIRKCLAFFDGLENKKTKYLTGQFIAAKAMKHTE